MKHESLQEIDRSGIIESAQFLDSIFPRPPRKVEIQVRKGLGWRLKGVE